ncbi:RadC-like JAB domain [Cardinium endosymbiont of Sogatella furcifera]|uniref:JAB domain-containing protein n=1 Tax=Cardinium endosymbiont of Sogatella furcifera TaxID=650378 RepID=UPI000E0D5412|nr:JAB domain-containing protein [Cardinium endosymbiont of Sogatella furcifera]AXI24004.1 RadC-like JAB domain [Cardinium endosymbiont of Sogatella furcifera]
MIIRLRNQDKIAIHNSYDAHKIMQHILNRDKEIDLTKEHFWTIALDIRKIIVNIELLGIGSSYRVAVPLKDIFCIPYQKKAATLILIHNHPSGRFTPSETDIDFTDHVTRIGDIVNIQVVDHLILGGYRGKTNHYYSFKDQHIMEGLELSTKYLLKPEAEALFMKQITQLNNIIELQKENNKLIFKKGEEDKSLAIAKAMIQEGEPIEKIIRFTGLSEPDIQQLS